VNNSADDLDVLLADVDPTKLGVDVQPRFLDRQIVITVSATDDKTFNALAKVIETMKDILTQELQSIRQHSKP
jgi:hypothetical protein